MVETGKAALVLGASGAIGGAVAGAMLARGWSVALHCHTRRDRCEELKSSAVGAQRVEIFQADLTDAAAVSGMVAEVLKQFPRIDAVVWCCGIVNDAPLAMQAEDEMRAVLNTDLKALFLVLKAFSRQYIKQKAGTVLAVSSHAGEAGRVGGSAYAMAHAGMLALVKSAAREWGGLNVRVNAVIPPFLPESPMGLTATPEFIEVAERKRVIKGPTARLEGLAEFMMAVLENPGISGQVLRADARI